MERVYFICWKLTKSLWISKEKEREKFPFSELAGLINPHAATKTESSSWRMSQSAHNQNVFLCTN